ncbi:PilZ domain-containing protein [Bacterioplanoides sp.]|uniref:PilZ domain-containing protein n=1 Tax=Bacterioplanoides sp. TaxID=2066072 RepID=UPI003B5A7F33
MTTERTPSTKEQRMHPRWTLKSTVSVFEHGSKEYLGLLVDCSETGIMISSYEPLPPGTTFELDLVDIPPNIDGRRTGNCVAEVVWSDKLTPSLYGNGCTISGATDMLKTMMKSYSHS